MRKTAVIACVPLLAVALSAQTTTNDRAAGEGGRGVTVMVLPPSPQTGQPVRYVLNEPAYVAVFVVYPGAGVRLLYPTVDVPERLHSSGYNTEQLIGASFDNDIYRVVLGPRLAGPAYLYVVASRHPLDVARYVHRPMRLASAVGERESRSFYTDVQFDALLNNAITLGDDTSWDSDVYMLWPNSVTSTGYADAMTPDGMPTSRYTILLCGDGSTRVVPINYPFAGCPGQARVRPSIVATRQIQQTASAAPTPAKVPATVGPAPAPTVLPTIIGARITNAERRADIQQRAASQRLVYTAANGEQQVATSVGEATSLVQLPGIEVRVEQPSRGTRGDRDAIHGQYWSDGRQQYGDRRGENEQNRGTAEARLSPNPQLAPNPTLAPSPGFSGSETRSAARRMDGAQREFGAGQRSYQQNQSQRYEQPRASQPTAAPSAQGSAEHGSDDHGGRPRATP